MVDRRDATLSLVHIIDALPKCDEKWLPAVAAYGVRSAHLVYDSISAYFVSISLLSLPDRKTFIRSAMCFNHYNALLSQVSHML